MPRAGAIVRERRLTATSSRRAVLLGLAGLLVERPGAARGRARGRVSSRPFFDDYRISRYLELATRVQALPPEPRVKRLRALARADQTGETFPLCRMLFEERPNGFFRSPEIGAPVFVDGDSVGNWPLEPITLFRNVPILIVRGYKLGGHPETAEDYLAYCLKDCHWRDLRYAPVDAQTLGDIVERFVQGHPAITDPDWIRRQAQ